MEHTKGPWTCDLFSVYANDFRVNVASCYGNSKAERCANAELIAKAPAMYDQLASARAIMQKFVDKVDRGMAKSIETYTEMKQWMEDE